MGKGEATLHFCSWKCLSEYAKEEEYESPEHPGVLLQDKT
jgi:hypothetical protein